MKRICYTFAVLLALTWGLTFFFLHVGPQGHIFILLAVIAYLHAILNTSQKKYILREMKQGELVEESAATQTAA